MKVFYFLSMTHQFINEENIICSKYSDQYRIRFIEPDYELSVLAAAEGKKAMGRLGSPVTELIAMPSSTEAAQLPSPASWPYLVRG